MLTAEPESAAPFTYLKFQAQVHHVCFFSKEWDPPASLGHFSAVGRARSGCCEALTQIPEALSASLR